MGKEDKEKVWEEVKRITIEMDDKYREMGKNFVESGECQEMMRELLNLSSKY